MNAICQEIHEGRAIAPSNGSTPQIVAQAIEASRVVHVGQRPFAPVPRCDGLKGVSLSVPARLEQNQKPAALRGKIQEVRTQNQPARHSAEAGFSYV